jgi:uncharacterized protein
VAGVLGWAGSLRAQPLAELPSQVQFPKVPAASVPILDLADLITEQDLERIASLVKGVAQARGVTLYLVTLRSLSDFGAGGVPIEDYAENLLASWSTAATDAGKARQRNGVLLLVARRDRAARIQLGPDWNARYDEMAETIMQNLILPRFRQDLYSEGIQAGIEGLSAMIRGEELPRAPWPEWVYWAGGGGLLLVVFSIVSFARKGTAGWAYGFWRILFMVIGFGLMIFIVAGASSRGRRWSSSTRWGGSSSVGFGGGGFRGGGGATGRW